ncbi:DNA polymerase III subunit alpha [Candidatus Uhrbacteria bacterium]|nr:DNA polymerase III subunit alpha [Candidatus Uhrbacteria bacterium]
MSNFVHLHTHSHYSLLDGLPKIPDLVARAKEHGSPALALTDHGVMYGALEFYQECKKQGIKPIVGMEAYVAPGTHTEKRATAEDDYHHLTLLAKDEEGYKNLMHLSTVAHLEGYYYRPRIDKKLLRAHSRGLIALSGCLSGEISKLIIRGQTQEARKAAQEFIDIFGKEDFFVEVQHHPELKEQVLVNEALFKLSAELGIEAVATVDSHYLHAGDGEAQDVLVCVQTGRLVTDKDRLNMSSTDLSFKSPQEVEQDWKEHPEVVANTLKIAQRVNLEIPLYKWAFPKFPVPDGKKEDEYLRELVFKSAKARFGDPLPDEIRKRINYELDVIERTGFVTYFLIVSDYVRWARAQGIAATTRGSAAGSIVAYLTEITTVNPLDLRLPFERFLTVSRPSPPDIDVDFADNRRDEVIEYVRHRFGQDKVAQICTFGTMLPRAAVRDVTRVLGLPYSFGDKLSKMIPAGAQGFHMTVDRALEANLELKKFYEEDERVRRVLDLARKVEGCARHSSVHAAGIVISPTALTDFTPLQREAQGDNVITQYDMHAVEAAGLIKMDMLGIRNLSILGNAVEIVEKTKGVRVDIGKIPLDDARTFAMLSRGETMGVFQLSGSGMTRYLKDLKPSSIHDIMAMVALFRPGPMESIPEYIRRKHNAKLISYLDPRLEPILERTYGILVYQDDVLMIAIELAGYSWEEADKLRKAMGKKIPREMMAQREKFLLGCLKNNLTRAKAEELWKLIEPFAAYGFNKAHAASYGMVSYQTAYMKANWPSEFITAILTAEAGNTDKLAEVILGAREAGITVLPPDINESYKDFTYVDDQTIRFGLLAIKNLGSDVVDAVIAERKNKGPYQDSEDFLKRVQHKNLNKKSLESLAKSGALDRFGDRGVLLENMEAMLAFNHSMGETPSRQNSLFSASHELTKFKLKDGPPATRDEKLSWEKELLGLYVTAHPLDEFKDALLGKTVTTAELVDLSDNSTLLLAGVLTECKVRMTRAGEQMAVARLQDLTGSCEVIAFPKVYRDNPKVWSDGALLCVWGRGGGEEKRIICERAEILTNDTLQKVVQGGRVTQGAARGDKELPRAAKGVAPASDKRVVVHLKKHDRDILETLRAFFSSARGSTPVYIVFEQEGQKRTIQTSFQIDPEGQVLQSIESIVGKGGVQLINS